MWCFIAFGTSIYCFPAPPFMFHHIQPYTTGDAFNFDILCNMKFPGKRVGWLRRMKRSRTVGQEKTNAKAWCTVMVLMITEERSLWDVQWLLLPTNLPQDCWEALKDYFFAVVAICSILSVGFLRRTTQVLKLLMLPRHGSLLISHQPWPFVSAVTKTQIHMFGKQQLISESVITFSCLQRSQLLFGYLQLKKAFAYFASVYHCMNTEHVWIQNSACEYRAKTYLCVHLMEICPTLLLVLLLAF